jgi:hypothetical protein
MTLDMTWATIKERRVTMTKKTGMTHSSLSLDGDKEKATFENRREGVNIEMFSLFNCWEIRWMR